MIHATPKFYLFDVGVANHLSGKAIPVLKGAIAGKAFEHFIFMELTAYLGLNEIDLSIQYWRTKSGLKVDFILDRGGLAIEVKISEHPEKVDLKGLIAYSQENQPKHSIVVCLAPRHRVINIDDEHTIEILPWQTFLENLWSGEYFTT